jgi:DNA replication protein DnaC
LLPTVITSNIYLEELRKIPGWDRLVDRIVEMATAVKMEGKSYRMRGKLTGKEVQ